MIKPSTSTHWYYPDGSPAYDKTLRDARKEPLFPSVTQVIGIIGKPMVDAWAVNLMSETCYTNQVYQDDCDMNAETLEEYRARIEPIYQEKRSVAAIRGSLIHDYAEACINDDKREAVPFYEKQCELISAWIADNIDTGTAEESFSINDIADACGTIGYGGRIDCYGYLRDGRACVIDFKTQDLKGKPKPMYYDEWLWQLGAYAKYLSGAKVGLSVVIDTGDIQKIHVKEYTREELDIGYAVFESILKAWYAIKGL